MPELLQGVPLPDLDPTAVLAASARVRNYCGWHIAPEVTETLLLPVTGVRLRLPSLSVATVSAVTVDGLAVGFDWSPAGDLLLDRLSIRRSLRGLSVTLTHGFATCPEDVRRVVAGLASAGVVAQPRLKSSTQGPFAVSYFDNSDPLDDLAAYRLPVVA